MGLKVMIEEIHSAVCKKENKNDDEESIDGDPIEIDEEGHQLALPKINTTQHECALKIVSYMKTLL